MALLLMLWHGIGEAHKVVDLLRHAPKDDIIVMLCMSLTVLFDMVIAISTWGLSLLPLLFMRRIARMTRLRRSMSMCLMMCWCCVLSVPLFAAAEGTVTALSHVLGKRIVVLKWDAVPVLDAGGLDAFQRFCEARLPEGCGCVSVIWVPTAAHNGACRYQTLFWAS